MSIKPREMKQVILKRMKVFGGNEHHLENGFVHEIFKQVPSTMRSNEALPGQVNLLGQANCKPGGRTLDTQTASADLSLTSAALSSCIPPLPMQSAYDPYLPGVVSTPNPLCIIAPLLHSQCPIDADLRSTWPPPPAHPHHLLTAKYLPWPQIFVPMKFGPRLQTLVYFSLTLISVPFSCVSAFECRTPAGCTPPHQHPPSLPSSIATPA